MPRTYFKRKIKTILNPSLTRDELLAQEALDASRQVSIDLGYVWDHIPNMSHVGCRVCEAERHS